MADWAEVKKTPQRKLRKIEYKEILSNNSFQIKKNLLRNRDWPNGVQPTDENKHRSKENK